jgi:hypothetical protein
LHYLSTELSDAQQVYGVSPYVFGVLYAIKVVLISYCLAQAWRSLRAKQQKRALAWVVGYVCSLSLPFLYILLCGRNFPWWVRPLIAGTLLVVAGCALYRLRRMSRSAEVAE